jgi:hypothetical protein
MLMNSAKAAQMAARPWTGSIGMFRETPSSAKNGRNLSASLLAQASMKVA